MIISVHLRCFNLHNDWNLYPYFQKCVKTNRFYIVIQLHGTFTHKVILLYDIILSRNLLTIISTDRGKLHKLRLEQS